MQSKTVVIPASAQFSLKSTVLGHGWHECSPMSWSEGGRCFQLIDREGDQVFRLSVTEERRSRANRVSLRVHIETTELDHAAAIESRQEALLQRLRVTLGLDRDLAEFYRLCAAHPALRMAPEIGAGRVIRSASMTENILKAICGTNVNWTQAVKMINRVGQLGPIVPHYRSQTAWPTPREILRAGETYLKEVCRLGYRTGTIVRFCRDVVEGRFDPEGLDRLAGDSNVTSDEIVALLQTVPGIGPSSAHYLLGFLGRHDRLSIDSATIAHVRATHTDGRKPTLKQIERIYAPYGRWKNLVYWVEHWLTWGTARQILREFGQQPPSPPTRKGYRGGRSSRRRLTSRLAPW